MPQQITNEDDAKFVAGKIRDGTLTGERKENAFQALEAYESGNQSLAPEAQQPEEVKLNFLQRINEDLDNRKKIYWEVTDAYLNDEISYGEGLLNIAGKVGAGVVLDYVGEILISGGRGLSAITPDEIEGEIKDAVTNVAHSFLNTDIGQRGLEAAVAGVESWNKFKEESPRSARNIESVVDIALLAAPVKSKPKAKPGKLGELGDSALASSERVAAKHRMETIEDLVTPKKDKAVRIEEVKRTSESGVLKTKKVELSKSERAIVEEVSKIPGVSYKNSLQENYNVISVAARKEAKRLKTLLAKNDFAFHPTFYKTVLKDVGRKLKDSPVLVGDAAKSAKNALKHMRQFAAEQPQTGSGLLRARKKFDAWVRSQRPKAFDPVYDNAMSLAIREIRTATNDFIAQYALNVGVKKSLRKQSLLLKAMENIAPKAADELGNILLRAWHKGLQLLPLRGEFNQAGAALFGIGGLGASALFAPVFTKLVFGSIGFWAAYKYLTGSASRREVGKLLKGIDAMIRKTKDANLIKELRADRALLLEISKTAEQELLP